MRAAVEILGLTGHLPTHARSKGAEVFGGAQETSYHGSPTSPHSSHILGGSQQSFAAASFPMSQALEASLMNTLAQQNRAISQQAERDRGQIQQLSSELERERLKTHQLTSEMAQVRMQGERDRAQHQIEVQSLQRERDQAMSELKFAQGQVAAQLENNRMQMEIMSAAGSTAGGSVFRFGLGASPSRVQPSIDGSVSVGSLENSVTGEAGRADLNNG